MSLPVHNIETLIILYVVTLQSDGLCAETLTAKTHLHCHQAQRYFDTILGYFQTMFLLHTVNLKISFTELPRLSLMKSDEIKMQKICEISTVGASKF